MADDELSDIERRVAADRAALARSLDMLSDTVAPERLKAGARDYGGQIGQQLWDATRENPAAFALVGAGLALMLSGTGRRAETDGAAGPAPVSARAAVGEAPASERRVSARRLRAALNRGLDTLPPAARERVLAARRRAIAAQERVERRAAKLGRTAEGIARDQPIAVAASAFGVGALVAALLPSTRREDALMGAERDALMDEAGAALAREFEALRESAGNAPRKGHSAQPVHVSS